MATNKSVSYIGNNFFISLCCNILNKKIQNITVPSYNFKTMISKNIILIIVSIAVISCSGNEKKDTQTIDNQTPEVLQENRIEQKVNSSLYGSRYDIVDELFKEAIKKDSELSNLMDNFYKLNDEKKDSTAEFLIFKNKNSSYWQSSEYLASSVSDSLIKIQLLDFLKTLKTSYLEDISDHDTLLIQIAKNSTKIEDQLIALKLITTYSMIMNYQNNELPDISSIENFISTQESILKTMKEKSKIVK
jgi:hypothetical protein